MRVHFILYVENQEESTRFYRSVLDLEPVLEVAGMTEFQLNESSVLGLMPETGIKKLLGPALPDPKGHIDLLNRANYSGFGTSGWFWIHRLSRQQLPRC